MHEYGIYVCVLNPLFIKQSGGGSIRKVKTDKADAMKIAKYGLDNWVDLREYTPMDTVRQQLKPVSYTHLDENHPATVSDIIAHLNGKGIQAVRQTVYADTNALIDAGIDIVVVKSTQNQYFMGNRLFEYPELKMLTDARCV